jgi:hypothetical protein
MPNRADMSPNLIHFIRARSSDEAMVTMREIIGSGCLKGSNTTTRGGFHTISFTETPLRMMAQPLLAGAYEYSPFGIQVSKKWLFAQGGRNVTYQTAEEFDALPDSHNWRHVRYEPHVENGVDFHWEREWRIRADTLHIDPTCAAIVVPHPEWERRIEAMLVDRLDLEVQPYALVVGETLAEAYRSPFEWEVITVEGALS